MDKILISNSFKNLLQSLGAKDASNLSNISSKAVPVVDTASGSAGTLLGYSTMSTLASVLGDTMFGNTGRLLSNGQDLNGINFPGLYTSNQSSITSTLLNKPDSVTSGFVMVCSYPYGRTDYGTQIIIHSGTLFLRYNYGTYANPNWGGWKQLQFVA